MTQIAAQHDWRLNSQRKQTEQNATKFKIVRFYALDFIFKQEMRPPFFCGWPLNFPICGGVFYHISYNLHWGPQALPFIMYKHAEMAE